MKRFKDILNEGNDSYPADDMTISELKIACYAAQNILDRIEDGAMVQRWQISAIVKAKEELASVYTSMSADELDDEDEAHEYHYQMNVEEVELDETAIIKKMKRDPWTPDTPTPKEFYKNGKLVKNKAYYDWVDSQKAKNEEVDLDEAKIDKNHPIAKEYYNLKKKDLKDLKDMIAQRSKISDTSEFRSKEHAASHLIRKMHGDKKVDQVFGFNEEVELDEGYNDPEYIRRAIPALKNAVEFHKDTMEIHDKKSTKGSPAYVKAHSSAAAAHKEAAERHKIAHAQLSNGTKDVEYYVKPAIELGAYAEKLSNKANALKEEVEQIDEISKELLRKYKKVAKDDEQAQHDAGLNASIKQDDKRINDKNWYNLQNKVDNHERSYFNRRRGQALATKKIGDRAKVNATEEVEQIDEISKKLAKSYLDKSAAEREANPKYSTREKFRSRMIGGATADAKLKGRVEQPYKFGQAPKRKMYVKVAATNEEVDLDEAESWESGYDRRVVKTTKPEHKEKGYNWRIKGKERPDISIKLFKDKPSQAEFNKEMKRIAGHEFGG